MSETTHNPTGVPFTHPLALAEGERGWIVALDRGDELTNLVTWSGMSVALSREWADHEAQRNAASGEWERVTLIEGERHGGMFKVLSRTPYAATRR